MKGIDVFCASQAATAICLSMDEISSSSSSSSSLSSIQLGSGRAIDRFNPIIRDPKRFGKTLPSCSSQPPISPKPNDYQVKYKTFSSKENNEPKKKKKNSNNRLSNDEKRKSSTAAASQQNDSVITERKSWSCTKPGDFISPPGSSRYLLSDQAFLNVISDFDPVLKVVPAGLSKTQAVQKVEHFASKPSSSSGAPDQVVVLRVSLHCRGCERKMRKHISRMEGVSSFNIDFAAKKVTVVGNVTPLDVLASISKVKNAQLWTTPAAPPLGSPVNNPSNPEIKKFDLASN